MIRRFLSLALLPLFALSASAQLSPEKGLAAMKPAEGLQVELFAAEPMVINPTSIDVDDKGRVWVSEAVNYRRKNFNRPILRKEGDRIQVLIDEKGEGKATKAVTFYQGKELYGPLSVCVIPVGKGYRVLVAQSPDILEFACKDATNPVADGPPKKFLTGFGGFDHDHGVHGLHLGPDGKLYFTVGDQGVKGLQASDGKGRKFDSNRTDCQGGTVWRCDLDGTKLELIAHNFRNNYEACVDSFGEIWLSDNDDDGNQQTRICHVMPGGNYGYFPRGAGQSHWHEEQPGIVHKTLRTGFGSPTGIQFYEGSLLGKKYTGTLLHCDAGPKEVRAFTRKPKGAGYELDKEVILTSGDNFFRPSDVCTAPDGSVFVADWYDRGVGGHGMGDPNDGRIYRLTPKGHKGYKVPEVKLDTKEGVLAALTSPNLTTRSLALYSYATPTKAGVLALADGLNAPFIQDAARATWAFVHMSRISNGKKPVEELTKEEGERIATSMIEFGKRQAGTIELKCAVLRGQYVIGVTPADPRPQQEKWFASIVQTGPEIWSEMLLMSRDASAERLIPLFYTLAKLYDGKDIFYRAALNIACGTDPERRDKILADFEKHFPEWNDKVADLVWELRPKSMLPKMEKLLADPKITAMQKARIVDIIASSDDISAGKTMLTMLASDASPEAKARAFESLKLFLPTKWSALKKGTELGAALDKLLADDKLAPVGLQLVAAANATDRTAAIAALAGNSKSADLRRDAIRTLGQLPSAESFAALRKLLDADGAKESKGEVYRAVAALAGKSQGQVQKDAVDLLSGVVLAKDADAETRNTAIEGLAGSRVGTQWLLAIKERGGLPESMAPLVGRLLRNTPFQDLRNKAALAFPAPGKLDPKKLPAITELAKRVGNADNGKAVMAKSLTSEVQCMKCHMVRGQGGSIGPDLSMVGKKATKENLYESMFQPSKAIADQYLSWKLDGEDGQSITGLLVGETETTLTIRDANGKDYQFPVKGTERKKQLTSIMPEALVATLTEDELVDVVEYLSKLQTPSLTPDNWQILGPVAKKLEDDFGSLEKLPWATVKTSQTGYVDLAAFHGAKGANSVSVMTRTIESPVDQEATILLGTDDGCRLFVNGEKVFGHDKAVAAAPEQDNVKVKLKKGMNTILLKVSNGDNPHGFYFAITSKEELKLTK